MTSQWPKYIAFIVLCSLATKASAQRNHKISISEKHKQKIEKIQDPRKKLIKYRKFYSKDSINYLRKLDKQLKNQSDSIYAAMRKLEVKRQELVDKVNDNKVVKKATDAGLLPPGALEGGKLGDLKKLDIPTNKLDKINQSLADKDLISSTDKIKQKGTDAVNSKVDEAGGRAAEIKKETTPYQQYYDQYKDFLNHPDSLQAMVKKVVEKELESLPDKLAEKGGGMAEMKHFQQQKALAEKFKAMPEKYQQELKQVGDAQQMKAKGKEMAKQKAIEFLAANQDKIAEAQKKMSKLKKVYCKVPNSNDLSTAVKINSLKGKPFKERLYIGGNFQVINLDPFSIDFSPSVGYRWNKKFITGIGAAYRHTFGDYDPNQTTIPENNYGINAFAQYDVMKGFFAFGAYEYTSHEFPSLDESASAEAWVPGLMVGAGKTMSFHPKINTQLLALYNFLHEPGKSPYKSPWVLKAGFSLK